MTWADCQLNFNHHFKTALVCITPLAKKSLNSNLLNKKFNLCLLNNQKSSTFIKMTICPQIQGRVLKDTRQTYDLCLSSNHFVTNLTKYWTTYFFNILIDSPRWTFSGFNINSYNYIHFEVISSREVSGSLLVKSLEPDLDLNLVICLLSRGIGFIAYSSILELQLYSLVVLTAIKPVRNRWGQCC